MLQEVQPTGAALVEQTPAFYKGELTLRGKKGRKKFVRIVWVNSTNTTFAVMKLKKNEYLKTAKPVVITVSDFLSEPVSRIPREEDPFLWPEMLMADQDILSFISHRDERWSVLSTIIGTPREADLFRGKKFKAILTELAQLAGVSESTIRRWLTDFWQFGCNKNACIGRGPQRGGRGMKRIGAATKAGRYSSGERLARLFSTIEADGNEAARPAREGRAWSFEDGKNAEWALTNAWADLNLSYEKTHGRMIKEKYEPKGKTGPTFWQFRYRKDEIIKRLDLKPAKAGQKQCMNELTPRTGTSASIADGPLDIFQADGTPFPHNLLGGWDELSHVKNPTVVIVVDVVSQAIVGFHDSFTAENWDCYRMALFSAFTPKTELLKELRLPADTWPFHGLCHGLYVDNGPGMSDRAKDTLAEELRMERIKQIPREPVGKGVVENLIRVTEDAFISVEGAWPAGQGPRFEEERAKAIKKVSSTVSRWRRDFVLAISEFNKRYVLPESQLSQEMIDAGVYTPEEIFIWGKKAFLRGDRARGLSQKEIYLKLLPREKLRTVSQTGICVKSKYYSSDALDLYITEHARVGMGRRAQRPKIEVMYDPARPGVLYWATPDGKLDTLVPNSEPDRQKLTGKTWLDVAIMRMNYTHIKTDRANHPPKKRRTKGFATTEQTKRVRGAIAKSGPPSKGEVAAAREAERELSNDSIRKRTAGFLPDDKNLNYKRSPQGPEQTQRSGVLEAFDELFGGDGG